MSEVKASGSVASYTGILFELLGNPISEEQKAYTTDELWAMIKQSAVEKINELGGFPYIHIMPCGAKLEIGGEPALMLLKIEDIPCPCGDPSHWLIRFIDLREDPTKVMNRWGGKE